MEKKIIITQREDGTTTLSANKGIKWATFITGIEMMIECIKDNKEVPITIDDMLLDIKRIYERDNSKIVKKNN